MSKLKQEATSIIENMPENLIPQAISYLKNIEPEKTNISRSMEGLQTLLSFAGTLPPNFQYKKELEEAREEKYGSFY